MSAPDFRCLVTGSRHLTPDTHGPWVRTHLLAAVLRADPARRLVLVHGAARGLDTMAATLWPWLCAHLGRTGDVDPYPADWYGPCQPDCRHRHREPGDPCWSAGGRRNQLMVDSAADICVAFPLPGSRGTRDCLDRAQRAGIPIHPVPSWRSHA